MGSFISYLTDIPSIFFFFFLINLREISSRLEYRIHFVSLRRKNGFSSNCKNDWKDRAEANEELRNAVAGKRSCSWLRSWFGHANPFLVAYSSYYPTPFSPLSSTTLLRVIIVWKFSEARKQLFLGRERRDKYKKKKKLCPVDASRWRVEIGNDYFIQSVDGAENFIFSWQIGRKKERKEEKKWNNRACTRGKLFFWNFNRVFVIKSFAANPTRFF